MSAETVPALPPSHKPLQDAPYVPPGGIAMSLDEYREFSRKSEIPYEYANGYAVPKFGVYEDQNGEIRAMSGETPVHNRIALNVSGFLDRAIGEQPCEVYIENIKLRTSPGKFRFPDVTALCGEAEFDGNNPPALLNPTVIVEVLSPSTASVDRGEKFEEYRQIGTVTDYLLIAQDKLSVLHYVRQSPLQWMNTEYTALTGVLTLEALDISLTLADVYRKIIFAPPV